MRSITPNTARIATVAGLVIGTIAWIALSLATQKNFINDAWILVTVGLLFYLPIAMIAVAPAWFLFPRIVRAKSSLAKLGIAIVAMLLPAACLTTVIIANGFDGMTAVVACLFLPTNVAAALLALGEPNGRRPATDRFQIDA
jgi:hypothetical protein